MLSGSMGTASELAVARIANFRGYRRSISAGVIQLLRKVPGVGPNRLYLGFVREVPAPAMSQGQWARGWPFCRPKPKRNFEQDAMRTV